MGWRIDDIPPHLCIYCGYECDCGEDMEGCFGCSQCPDDDIDDDEDDEDD